MHILIQSEDGQEGREVADMDEAQALADSGLHVLVPNKDGGHRPLAATAGPVEAPAPVAPKPVAAKRPAAKKVAAKTAAKRK